MKVRHYETISPYARGGDIASGAVYRLKRAGYPVVINEIAIPTMIRREVCYGNAVHRGEMILERFVARHVAP